MIASLFIMAVGEIILSPRYYEYVSRLAPPGQQGTYMGFAFLPVAIGYLIGGKVGGYLVHYFGDVLHRPAGDVVGGFRDRIRDSAADVDLQYVVQAHCRCRFFLGGFALRWILKNGIIAEKISSCRRVARVWRASIVSAALAFCVSLALVSPLGPIRAQIRPPPLRCN